ncbi:M23 family metallopeptidase [Streptomyces sp. NPDC048489]|uniref:M23 family metallopeptidase n=1 Tax=Streptomyces sp. NPDC048489 TaxID=3154504 RepID=UPI00344834AD
MQHFRPTAFDPSRSRKKLVASWIAIVISVGGIAAFTVVHDDSSNVQQLADRQSVVPPTGSHHEPLDGGSALIPQSGEGGELSDFFDWLLGLSDGRGDGKNPPPSGHNPSAAGGRDKSEPKLHPDRGWNLPVADYVKTARYGQPGDWAAGHHTGIDLAVPVGTQVKAVHDGTVIYATFDKAYGNYVLVHQADGLYVLYAHMSKLDVRPGQEVKARKLIGLSGATGRVTGPHLHFEVRNGPAYGSDIDPVAYMRRHGVTL